MTESAGNVRAVCAKGRARLIAILVMPAVFMLCAGIGESRGATEDSGYARWATVGRQATNVSLALMKKETGTAPRKENLVVVTNAGYAEVDGLSTQGALDGVARSTGAGRGRNTLVEVHSASWDPLWFAFHDKASGLCAYLELNSSALAGASGSGSIAKPPSSRLFGKQAIERINATYLYAHPADFKAKLDEKVFGANAFRIVTIANAVAEGAPAYAVRAFEFHDHYCPGVTSGILIANYLKKHFPPGPGSSYFVHSVDPWCKEDALMVLLNATPGKKAYAVSYPTDADKAMRVPEAQSAATIAYRQTGEPRKWEGVVLGFQWAETQCPKTCNDAIDKLCADLWYLKRMDRPEEFVKVIKSFEMPEGVSPKDWARPGVDPLEKLGLIQTAR